MLLEIKFKIAYAQLMCDALSSSSTVYLEMLRGMATASREVGSVWYCRHFDTGCEIKWIFGFHEAGLEPNEEVIYALTLYA